MGFAPMADELGTDRLLLRSWSVADAEWYVALVTERGVDPPDLEAARERIATGPRFNRGEAGIALLTVRLRDEGDPIGYCGLIVGRASTEEPEIAYELFRHAHGHGYATEAAGAVVDAAAATGRTRLWSTVGSWNTASLRVLDKLGFHRDHTTTGEAGDIVWLTRTLP